MKSSREGFLEVVALGPSLRRQRTAAEAREEGASYLPTLLVQTPSPPFLLGFTEQLLMYYDGFGALWCPSSQPPARLLMGVLTLWL